MTLPRTLDELRGRRAARWIRESTAGQVDTFGPDAQREQQDRALERYGLVDTGLAWQVAHSGRTVDRTPAWAAMVAAAGSEYDVLVVGYVSRFARDLRTAVNARHELHARGAALLFADERILSSDEEAWEVWAREAVEAEAYSRRLAKRIREGYAAKFRRHADQGGSAPLGFRRTAERPHLLEVDPASIERVVALFRAYASGAVSLRELGIRTGLPADGIRALLANPIYNGWVRRHRRSASEELSPAAWRADPPVDDELWARVQAVRQARYQGGGAPHQRYPHLLAGRLWCAGCGRRIRAEVTTKDRRWAFARYRHPERCAAWPASTIIASRFDAAITAQIAGAHFRPAHVAGLARLAAESRPGPTVASYQRAALEAELRRRAEAHAARRLTTEAYLAEHARLTAQLDALDGDTGLSQVIDPAIALARLRTWQRTFALMGPEHRAAIVRAVYERIEVAPGGAIAVRLTADAERHGLALALPETVVLARPAGARHDRTTVRIRVEQRRAWLAAVRAA